MLCQTDINQLVATYYLFDGCLMGVAFETNLLMLEHSGTGRGTVYRLSRRI
jgi:hypothetical protein